MSFVGCNNEDPDTTAFNLLLTVDLEALASVVVAGAGAPVEFVVVVAPPLLRMPLVVKELWLSVDLGMFLFI